MAARRQSCEEDAACLSREEHLSPGYDKSSLMGRIHLSVGMVSHQVRVSDSLFERGIRG